MTNRKSICSLDIPLYQGKIYTNVLPTSGSQGRLRVILVDVEKGQTFSNGQLMTCKFSVIGSGAQAALSVEGLRVATKQGTLLDSTAANGVVQIQSVCSAGGA